MMRRTRGPGLLVILLAVLSVAPTHDLLAAQGAPVTVVDNLGSATPQMTFSMFGSGAQVVSSRDRLGPMFSLTERTLITEIGVFANNCARFTEFVPDCPDTQPLTVEVRPAQGAVPDPVRVLASFELSHDDNPLVYSYEFVNPSLVLEAGPYFALFGAQGDDVGHILTSASNGTYRPPASIPTGFLDTETRVSTTELAPIAVRILGVLLGPDSSTSTSSTSTTSSTTSTSSTTTLPPTNAVCVTLDRLVASFPFLSPLVVGLRTVLGC